MLKKILFPVLLAGVLLTSTFSNAAGPGFRNIAVLNVKASDGTTFSAEDLTGPAQTEVFNVEGLAWVTFYLTVASVSGTANISTDCYIGPTSATATAHIQSESLASGVGTLYDYVPTKSVTTSDVFPVTFNVANHKFMYCTFLATSGTVTIAVAGGH